MSMKMSKRRPAQPGIYWFIPDVGEPMIVQLVRDGSGWFLLMLGTDEMCYLTRPREMSVKLWKMEKKYSGQWAGPLEPPR